MAKCGYVAISRREKQRLALILLTVSATTILYVLSSNLRPSIDHESFQSSIKEKHEHVHKSIQKKPRVHQSVQSAIIQDRVARVRDRCSVIRKHEEPHDLALYPPEELIVNEKYKIIYCNVPKVGSTNWKAIFLKIGGFNNLNNTIINKIPTNKRGRLYLDYLKKYSNVTHRRFMLENFTKFMIVRHPFTRILSAFRSKLAPNISFHFRYSNEALKWVSTYGKRIIKLYRGEQEAERVSSNWKTQYDLKFSEFIRFIVDSNTDSFNKHWSEVYSMCRPCDVDYDVIGKYETMNEDADFILKLAKVDPSIKYPAPVAGTATNSSEPGMAEKFYQDISRENMLKLYELYRRDFELFDYDHESYLKF